MNSRPESNNESDPSAITIEEAQQRINNTLNPVTDAVTIPVHQALGRVSSQTIVSPVNVPSFRASAMDGYAVRTHECHEPLILLGESLAGHPGEDRMPPGSAQRITTGARVPGDADAVVQQENTSRDGTTITINKQPEPGLHIRLPGTDTRVGQTLLDTGMPVGSAAMALLAAHGMTEVSVKRRLKIAVFSTGDELVEPGKPCGAGQIYDANRTLLLSMFSDAAIECIDLGICPDHTEALQHTLDAARSADMIVSSGGVSVGDADHVRSVLEKNGRVDVWKIAMKPGRPLTYALMTEGQAYFGLPGNPVSAAVTALLFVRPAIRRLLGVPETFLPPLHLPLQGQLRKNPGRVEYQRGCMMQDSQGTWVVRSTGAQDSHVLSSLHQANSLIELPIECCGVDNGTMVRVFPFAHLKSSLL